MIVLWYISRCVHLDDAVRAKERLAFGLVDTDDNVEHVISMDKLEKAVLETGIQIYGATIRGRRIDDAAPYQHPLYTTALQTKLAVMHNIHMTLYKDWITSIVWDEKLVKKPVTIRLSDYGRRCSDSLFWRPGTAQRHQVTLIFDNKIKFRRDSFAAFASYTGGIGVGGFGVLYDLRELSDDTLAEFIYTNIFESGADLDSVLDKPDRLKRMKA